MHRVFEPAEEIDVVPPLFVVATRRVVVDPHLVIDVAIEFRVQLGLKDILEDTELRILLGFEALRIVEHLAVAVAEDVRRVPATETEHARFQHRREHRFDQGLASLEIFSADRNALVIGEIN